MSTKSVLRMAATYCAVLGVTGEVVSYREARRLCVIYARTILVYLWWYCV
ncbi:hypothetical protein HMPREF3192_01219 [Atopobium deltae]|uniref:Uncharacterized protein n=1 Tax=Atopobium deltae TaxID=1393034 RepID=A0A133XQM7_9ACTN|nr:hypothetical protein HMPREF3192_01219 [Atopobium deltae]